MSWENSVYMLPGIDHKNKSSSSNLRIINQIHIVN